jgi:hypothetical protein
VSVWWQIVVKGPNHSVRSFVIGFEAGRGQAGGVVFGADVDLDPHSLGERLRELFAGGSHHVILAPEALARPLVAALEAHGAEVDVRLERHAVVATASFSLRIEVFARELVEERRAPLLVALPSGVRVEQVDEHEEKHPEAKGAELYTPLHDYVWRVSGRVVGELPGVLEVRRRGRDLDFVEVGPLRLEPAAPARQP